MVADAGDFFVPRRCLCGQRGQRIQKKTQCSYIICKARIAATDVNVDNVAERRTATHSYILCTFCTKARQHKMPLHSNNLNEEKKESAFKLKKSGFLNENIQRSNILFSAVYKSFKWEMQNGAFSITRNDLFFKNWQTKNGHIYLVLGLRLMQFSVA